MRERSNLVQAHPCGAGFYEGGKELTANMNLKVLGISASPRVDGSSDLLLRQALAGAESAGASTEYIGLRDFKLLPAMSLTPATPPANPVQDDFQLILQKSSMPTV